MAAAGILSRWSDPPCACPDLPHSHLLTPHWQGRGTKGEPLLPAVGVASWHCMPVAVGSGTMISSAPLRFGRIWAQIEARAPSLAGEQAGSCLGSNLVQHGAVCSVGEGASYAWGFGDARESQAGKPATTIATLTSAISLFGGIVTAFSHTVVFYSCRWISG